MGTHHSCSRSTVVCQGEIYQELLGRMFSRFLNIREFRQFEEGTKFWWTEQPCRIGILEFGKGLEGRDDRHDRQQKQIVGKGWRVGETDTDEKAQVSAC